MKTYLHHSHKKRKDSLEALAVLRIYVENQAMLEPILLHLASKCKQTKEQCSEDWLWTHGLCEDCLWLQLLPFYRF